MYSKPGPTYVFLDCIVLPEIPLNSPRCHDVLSKPAVAFNTRERPEPRCEDNDKNKDKEKDKEKEKSKQASQRGP